MELYVDLIWLLNLLFDALVLFTVAWMMKRPFNKYRIILASFYASLIIPLILLFNLDWLEHPIVKIIYSIGIILIAFKFESIQTYLLYFLAFYFINFAIGGGLFALHFLLQSNGINIPFIFDIGYGNSVSWIFIVISFPIVLFFIKNRLHQIAIIKLHNTNVVNVDIHFNNNVETVKGFVDTGNQLLHPITNQPIMLIEEKIVQRWFHEDVIEKLKQLNHFEGLTSDVPIHFIPFKKAGGEQGLLPVFTVDSVHIKLDDKLFSTRNVYVGIHFGEFSQSLSYQCLLHPELLQTKKTKIHHRKGVS